ncbi:MAG: hypothetical protein RLZZ24_1227, partial [Pseudomonadota bacterium]
MHCFDQRRHMLGRGELADAMPQIEDVGGAGGGGIEVRRAKRIEHATRFGGDRFGRGKQGVGI